MNNWFIPEGGIIPFARLDIEIWLETGGVSASTGQLMPKDLYENYHMNPSSMFTFIDAVLDRRDSDPIRTRQEGLIEIMFTYLETCYQGRIFDRVAQQLTQYGDSIAPHVIHEFIRVMLDSPMQAMDKVAIGAALLQYIDDIRIQSLMTANRSSPAIGRAEAKTLHALSLAGGRAYSRGILPPLEWPALTNWRNMHDER